MKYSNIPQIHIRASYGALRNPWGSFNYPYQHSLFTMLLALALLSFPSPVASFIKANEIKEARLDKNPPATLSCLPEKGKSPVNFQKELGNRPLFLETMTTPEDKPPSLTVSRLRYEKLNPHAFGQSQAQKTCSQAVYPEKMILNLFPQVSYTAVNRAIHYRTPQNFTWLGKIEGIPLSDVTLVVNDDKVTGNVNAQGSVYWIRPWQNDLHLIAKTNPSAFPLGGYRNPPNATILSASQSSSKSSSTPPPQSPSLPPQSRNSSPNSTTDSPVQRIGDSVKPPVTIDVMVVYTPAVAKVSFDIVSEICLAVEETNTAYLNSGIDQQLRLVHTQQVDYTESGSHFTDLKKLTYQKDQTQDSQGLVDEVHSLRDSHHADLVSLWVEGGNNYTCGVGWVLLPNSTHREKYGFTVVERYCASAPAYSFTHELGHNMGATHDKYATSFGVGGGITGAYEYSHGYVHITEDSSPSWRTIMASDKECIDQGVECPRIPYFSNPQRVYEATTVGNSGTNNSLTLNQTVTMVARFRASSEQFAEMQTDPLAPQKQVASLQASVSMADQK